MYVYMCVCVYACVKSLKKHLAVYCYIVECPAYCGDYVSFCLVYVLLESVKERLLWHSRVVESHVMLMPFLKGKHKMGYL